MEAPFQDIRIHMETTKDKAEYKRLRAVYLNKKEGLSATEAAKAVGTTKGVIYGLNHRYKKLGIQGLLNQPRGGRRWAYMSLEDEKKMLDDLANGAAQGLVVITKVIKTEAESRLGQTVSPDYAEDILHRHGWRKVAPRPKHPKSSKEDQEAFKKKSQQ